MHYILGNHEIKNLQGNFQSAHKKYFNVAGKLGMQQAELFGDASRGPAKCGIRNANPLRSDFLLDTVSGPSWYRGYFEDNLSMQQVDATLRKFQVKAVVVGHTPTRKVKTLFNIMVFAIDVKHPLDYRGSFPPRRSEGLRMEDDKAWRVKDDGSLDAL